MNESLMETVSKRSLVVILIITLTDYSLEKEICDAKNYDSDFTCWLPGYEDFKAGHRCLKFVRQAASFDAATAACETEGAELLSVHNLNESEALLRVFELLSASEIWIGLRYSLVTGRFHWSDNYTGADDWFPWAEGQSSVLHSKQFCVRRDTSGRWMTSDCTTALFFICQTYGGRKPRPPHIGIQFHQAPNVLFGSKTAVFNCTALVGSRGYVEFQWFQGSRGPSLTRGLDHQNVRALKDKTSAMDGSRCAKRITIEMLVKVGQDLDGKTIKCCSFSPHWEGAHCGGNAIVAVRYMPQKPKIKVQYVKDKRQRLVQEASCSTFVGSGGRLFWSLRDAVADSMTTIWSIDTTGKIVRSGPHDAPVHLTPVHTSAFYGPHMHSILRIEATHRPMVLSCLTQDPEGDGPFSDDMITTMNLSGNVYLPKRPKLLVDDYVDGYKSRVHDGQTFEISCTAFVGSRGVLTWVLTVDNGERSVWPISFLDGPLALFGSTLADVNITYTTDEYDTSNGPRINSTIALLITPRLNGADLSCYSICYDLKREARGNPFSVVSGQSRQLMSNSNIILAVTDTPERPSLEVYFHEPPNIVYRDRELAALCRAKTRDNGKMTWVFTTRSKVYKWIVDHHGKVTPRPKHLVSIEVLPKDDKDESSKNVIISRFKIKARRSFDDATLGCVSYDVSMTHFLDDTDQSLKRSIPISVISDPVREGLGAKYIKRGMGVGLGFILGVSLTTSVLMVLWERKLRLADTKH